MACCCELQDYNGPEKIKLAVEGKPNNLPYLPHFISHIGSHPSSTPLSERASGVSRPVGRLHGMTRLDPSSIQLDRGGVLRCLG